MDIMGSHLEGFKQGSDLTDLGRRCLRLPWAGGTAEEQERKQGPATAAIQVLSEVAWPGGEALGDGGKGMDFELGIIPHVTN